MVGKFSRFPNGRLTLGLLTHGGGDPVSHFVWSGAAQVAQERDVNLICFPGKPLRSPHGYEAQSNVLYELVDTGRLDGLVVWLAGTEYAERRAQCEGGVRLIQQWYPDITALRDVTLAQFEPHESICLLLLQIAAASSSRRISACSISTEVLTHGDEARLQRLTAASYAGARDLYEIGAPSMAAMMQAMLGAPDVIGARQAGAGFGGCLVALVQRPQVEAFAAHVTHAYHAATNIEPRVYSVQAAPGAGPL